MQVCWLMGILFAVLQERFYDRKLQDRSWIELMLLCLWDRHRLSSVPWNFCSSVVLSDFSGPGSPSLQCLAQLQLWRAEPLNPSAPCEFRILSHSFGSRLCWLCWNLKVAKQMSKLSFSFLLCEVKPLLLPFPYLSHPVYPESCLLSSVREHVPVMSGQHGYY